MASIKLKGDTSGEITISAPAVAGTNTISLQATTGTLATTTQVDNVYNSLGVRNLIINGDMRIAQRGTTFTSQTSTAYHLDRWEVSAYNLASGVYRVYQDTDVPSGQGFVNSLRLDCTTANGTQNANEQVYLQQQIEAQNFNHLKYFTASPDTVTLSFWIKSNLTGTYAVQLKLSDNGSAENNTSTQDYNTTYTISASNTWEKKTVTIELDDNATPTKSTGNALGGAISFWFGAGSSRQGRTADSWGANGNATTSADNLNILGSTSNDVWITGVQLEIGSSTPFEHRPYDMELARCMRYYELINDNNYNSYGVMAGDTSQGFKGCIDYQQIKRATPTITITGSFLIQGNSNQPGTTSMGTSGIGKRSVYISGTGTGSNITNGFAYNLLDVNGYINVDAEL